MQTVILLSLHYIFAFSQSWPSLCEFPSSFSVPKFEKYVDRKDSDVRQERRVDPGDVLGIRNGSCNPGWGSQPFSRKLAPFFLPLSGGRGKRKYCDTINFHWKGTISGCLNAKKVVYIKSSF